MLISNTHKSAIALPGGQVLEPNSPTPVRNWDQVKKNAVVAAWLKAGVLREGDAAPPSALVPPDRDELAAQLTALGVKFHPRTGVEKLSALLAEHRERFASLYGSDKLPAHVEVAPGRTLPLGDIVRHAFAASGLEVDAWNALPADDREERLQAAIVELGQA